MTEGTDAVANSLPSAAKTKVVSRFNWEWHFNPKQITVFNKGMEIRKKDPFCQY
jgi:hypothetical protein